MEIVETIKVLVLHDDPLVHAGLTATLREHTRFALVSLDPMVSNPPRRSSGLAADVVVADYESGLEMVTRARMEARTRSAPTPCVLIVTQRDSEWEIRHALELGVRGYLVLGCGVDELLEGVGAVHRGLRHIGARAARRLADSVACSSLTCRETDVLRLVAEGRGNKVIARQLDIAIGTVKSHLKAIFEKLGATSRTEVAAIAERRGLLVLSPHRTNAATFAPPARRRVDGLAPSLFAPAVH